MNKKSVLVVVLVFVMLTNLFSAVSAQTATGDNEYPQATTAPVASQLIVVSNSTELSNAINNIADGGIIEMRAGIYPSPSDGPIGGFKIQDKGKGFTIRARTGESVTIDGGNQRALIIGVNSNIGNQRPVTFEGITFANGYSNHDSQAAGITMHYAEMTFVNCSFLNNRTTSNYAAGGAVQVSLTSRALFVNSIWNGNTTKTTGAAIEVQDHAQVYIHNSLFINNRTNLAGHSATAAGGAIHIGNSTVRISNSRFENNQAGYVGGAVYAIGQYDNAIRTDVIISNSTFVSNKAVNDPSVPLSYPTEGGAVHVESNARLRIYSSRFIYNTSQVGGGANAYRGILEIYNSVFLGNTALSSNGRNSLGGFGGAVSAVSNDTASDGSNNYPSTNVTIRNSYFQGRYGSVSTVTQVGGAIYVAGDQVRNYGLFGVAKMGTTATNRAVLTLDQSVFVELDTVDPAGKSASAGAVCTDMASATISNVLVTRSDAEGTQSFGGAMEFIDQSDVAINYITLVDNSAKMYGGTFFAAGSNVTVNNSSFLINDVANPLLGSVFFTKPDTTYGLSATGNIQNSTFSGNTSAPIFDERDSASGAINGVTYNNNRFFPSTEVYHYGVANTQNVADLNNFVVNRSNGTSTDKGSGNVSLNQVANVGALIAAPANILTVGAYGDTGPQPSYLAYGWNGSSGKLNNNVVSETGEIALTNPGNYTLNVGGQTYSTAVNYAATPTAIASLNKSSYPYVLTWELQAGTFLDAFADQHAKIPSQASGTWNVYPASSDAEYWVYIITAEGGVAVKTNPKPSLVAPDLVPVIAGLNTDFNTGSITIKNSGGGLLTWTASVDNDAVTLEKTSGETPVLSSLNFSIDASRLGIGTHTILITIDGGEAGIKYISVQLMVVATKYSLQLPLILR